jgi:hypothetical protein
MFNLKSLALLLCLTVIFSCSAKNTSSEDTEFYGEESDYLEEGVSDNLPIEETLDSPITEQQPVATVEEVVLDSNVTNYTMLSKRYKVSYKVASLINDNMEEFQPLLRDIVDIKNNGLNSRNGDRVVPIVINNINAGDDTLNYAKKIFPSYTVIARSKFISKSQISYNQIKGFASYINSSLIIMKGFYEISLAQYVYDIVFLSGDVIADNNYWFRTILESVSLEDTLTKLRIFNLNDITNIVVEEDLINNNTSNNSTIAEESENVANDPENNTNAQRQNIQTPTTIEDDLSLLPTIQTRTSLDAASKLSYQEQQKRLVAFRVETIYGLWQDIHSGDIYEIREIKSPQSNSIRNKKVGAYLIITTRTPLTKINNALNWINEDLRFEFSPYLGTGIYINDDKMPTDMQIRFYPAKGYLSIFLPNKEVRYLSPIIPDLDAKVYTELYSEIRKTPPQIGNYKDSNSTPMHYSESLTTTKRTLPSFALWGIPITGILLLLTLL